MYRYLIFILLPLVACKSTRSKEAFTTPTFDRSTSIETIAFGSCNKQYETQEMWAYVLENDPDLWIWLGDNIYGDTKDMGVMKSKYDQQKAHPEYQALLKKCPVIGTWDDHDYGINDGGKEFVPKLESKNRFMEFLDIPEDSEMRNHEGVYHSYVYGPKDKQVKVILLDTRYFRDPLESDPDSEQRYKPNTTGDVLGEAQWTWLEKELSESEAEVHLIGTSIQLLSEEHFYEKWSNFPQARQRFFDLIKMTQPQNLLLLSGDRHIAEFSKYQPEGHDQPIYEITASGLTHSWSTVSEESNQHRVGELIIQRNFAILQIDWSQTIPKLFVEVRGLNNKSLLREEIIY